MNRKTLIIWLSALALGALLGCLGADWLDTAFGYIATVYTRLFQFIAVPTIALAILTTLSALGEKRSSGKMFGRTLMYTLITTFAAALVALTLYLLIGPESLPADVVYAGAQNIPDSLGNVSYADHLLSVVPDNIVRPFLEGNVMSVLIIAAAMGLALAFMPEGEHRTVLTKFFSALQELFFRLIKAIIWALPLGILAFAGQLASQLQGDMIAGSLGKYVAVILGGNAIQIFIVLPIILLLRGLNPIRTLKGMSPALIVAFFTKSSAGTLPVSMPTAEKNLGVDPRVSRFVYPISTTINMNGCAAFILTTSLFLMQNAGMSLSVGDMLVWVLIAVFSAIGNAGVPMGCYFMTLSLMSGIGVPVGIMGIILPIYTVIDMVETAENVWSDSCVCAIINREFRGRLDADEVSEN